MAISSGTSGAAASPVRAALVSNYIDFTGSTNDWRQQYLPDLMEKKQRSMEIELSLVF